MKVSPGGILAAGLFWLSLARAFASPLTFPTLSEVKQRALSSEGRLLDRKGKLLHELRVNSRSRRLEWVGLDRVSQALKTEVIASEDHRFFSHQGVDWIAFASSALKRVVGSQVRGASTLSMQLVSLLADQAEPSIAPREHRRRSILQKLSQASAALALEKEWTKDQILEAYLNLVPFRGELVGITSVSRAFFSKDPHGLSRGESALLAALLRSPNAPVQRVRERACALLSAAECAEVGRELESHPLGQRRIEPRVALAPHLAAWLLPEFARPGRKALATTLDADLQASVAEILRKHVLSIRDRNAHDAAALVIDNARGEVRAYVGGLEELASARFVDGVRARRQAGSTLKPFLYALALDQRYLTASSPLEDSAVEVPLPSPNDAPRLVYRPMNHDRTFHGRVSLRTALASSLNVPAVRTLNLIGVPALLQALEQLGFEGLRDPEHYGPSLALGSADVTLWDLANAYRALANGGWWSPARAIHSSPEAAARSRRVFSEEATYLISDILSDRASRSLGFGLENPLALRFWAAAKTGTSKDMRDNWCLGFSEHFTVGVWVGNSSGTPMWNVSGISGAAPAWAEIMGLLHPSASAQRGRKPPRGLHRDPGTGEWYLSGTGPSAPLEIPPAPKILYPSDGLLIALDPDIPVDHQRVLLRAQGADGLRWVVSGEELAAIRPGQKVFWSPSRPGSYTVELRDAAHRAQAQVKVEVRGSAVLSVSDLDTQGDPVPPSP